MCQNYGHEAVPATVYFGDVLDIENDNGVWLYPDYPDRMIKLGPRDGIKIIKT